MAYKRNPMRSERISSHGRLVITQTTSPALTAALPVARTHAGRFGQPRIVLPEAFLATDAILALYRNVIAASASIQRSWKSICAEELPFLATENILMYCTKKGGDRRRCTRRSAPFRSRIPAREGRRGGGTTFSRVSWPTPFSESKPKNWTRSATCRASSAARRCRRSAFCGKPCGPFWKKIPGRPPRRRKSRFDICPL